MLSLSLECDAECVQNPRITHCSHCDSIIYLNVGVCCDDKMFGAEWADTHPPTHTHTQSPKMTYL